MLVSFDNTGLTGQNFIVANALEAQLKVLKSIFAFYYIVGCTVYKKKKLS